MKKIGIVVLFSMALLPRLMMGQCYSSQEKPAWVDGISKDLPNSYIEVVSATGYDEENAGEKAIQEIIKRRSIGSGQRAQVLTGDVLQVRVNDELTVKALIRDKYHEHCAAGEHRVYLLVQTAKNPEFQFERIEVTKDYGFMPSAFIPGMAQLQKGSTTKGVFFIAGEALLIGGVVIAENLRASYISKINTTHNLADKQNNINNADNWQNIRNGLIAGAAALYVWNVIDGCVAKGKKHVVILGNNNLKITPYATPNEGGISLALNF